MKSTLITAGVQSMTTDSIKSEMDLFVTGLHPQVKHTNRDTDSNHSKNYNTYLHNTTHKQWTQ